MSVPINIQRKMVAAAKAAPSLKKEERNDQAGFNFVGIDRFYSDVASVLHDLGIGWKTVEEGVEIAPIGDQVIVLQKFRFDVFDSESGDYAEGYSRLTVPAPFSDAQTAGISLSYADKAFLRSMLAVVTGEKDADHFAKKRGGHTKKVEVKDEDLDPGPATKVESKPAAELKQAAKPKAKKPEEPKPEPEEATSDASDAADRPPWEDAAQEGSELEAISDRLVSLLKDIKKEKAGQAGIDALDGFRNAETDDINKLKTAAAAEDATEEVKLQAEKVRKLFADLYDLFEKQVEGED